jgi:hypothetical protein
MRLLRGKIAIIGIAKRLEELLSGMKIALFG